MPDSAGDWRLAGFVARGDRAAPGAWSAAKKGSGTFCRNGPKGASHKRCLTHFSPAATKRPVMADPTQTPPSEHAEALAEVLARDGFDCVVAASGKEGARRIDQDEYDVVLTDLKMADLDGL